MVTKVTTRTCTGATRSAVAAAAVFLAVASARVSGADTVTTIEGDIFRGRVVSLDAEHLQVAEEGGAKRRLKAVDIASVVFDSGDRAVPAAVEGLVVTAAGSRLSARSITMREGTLTFINPALGKLRLAAEKTLSIFLPRGKEKVQTIIEDCRRRSYEHGSRDRLVIRGADGAARSVEGVLTRIGTDKIAFRFGGRERTISRSSVPAIMLAELAAVTVAPRCDVALPGGDVLRAGSVAIAENTITANTPDLGTVALDAAAGTVIRFRSDRVQPLAALKPAVVEERGFFKTTFTHRVNRSVGGGKIVLGGVTYDRGIGLHSYAALSWDIGRIYTIFLATVGIDDAVRPRGNAAVQILGDGKVLYDDPSVTGTDDPAEIKIDVSGVARLTIRVDFGADGLGVSDHVDVAAPRLIK